MTAGVRVFLSQHSRCIDRKAKEALAALERHARKDYRRQIPINFALGLVDILVDKRAQNGEVFAGPNRKKKTLRKRQSIAAQGRMELEKKRGERGSEGSTPPASRQIVKKWACRCPETNIWIH